MLHVGRMIILNDLLPEQPFDGGVDSCRSFEVSIWALHKFLVASTPCNMSLVVIPWIFLFYFIFREPPSLYNKPHVAIGSLQYEHYCNPRTVFLVGLLSLWNKSRVHSTMYNMSIVAIPPNSLFVFFCVWQFSNHQLFETWLMLRSEICNMSHVTLS